MYELSVASKYLLPKWKQLSVSIISLISMIVISLVVWLVVVFFSVTEGLEKNWVQKLIALTAPIRINPTENYYHSYYYLVDGISSLSGYTSKTIGEKLLSKNASNYDPDFDEQIPEEWSTQDVDENGNLKDIVKLVFNAVNELSPQFSGLKANDYELTFTNFKLYLDPQRAARPSSLKSQNPKTGQPLRYFIAQSAYLGSIDATNPALINSLKSLSVDDINNLMYSVTEPEDIADADGELIPSGNLLPAKEAEERLQKLLTSVEITSLKTPSYGWVIPKNLLKENTSYSACAISKGDRIASFILPTAKDKCQDLVKTIESQQGSVAYHAQLFVQYGVIYSLIPELSNKKEIVRVPIVLESGVHMPARMTNKLVSHCHQLCFHVDLDLQDTKVGAEVPLKDLMLAEAHEIHSSKNVLSPSTWKYDIEDDVQGKKLSLNKDDYSGDAVLLPKGFRDAGALVGDRGYLTYHTMTASSVIEQKLPVYVAGFYDPGIIPMGGKYILATPELTSLISASHNRDTNNATNGIHVRFDDLSQAEAIKAALQSAFDKEGISPYWKIETFREFEFTKDLLQQLKSEKHLFSLIAMVIIIVACSNIISMLIILVNDKKLEIGILRSMGASSMSIALIFGLCGVIMGIIGSFVGIIAAILTLNNLQFLIDMISKVQGHELFNPVFYGDKLPTELSSEAILFVVAVTGAISMLAGLVPAMKAAFLNPAAVLKSE